MKYTAIEILPSTYNVATVYAVGLFSDVRAEELNQVLNAFPEDLHSLVQGQIQYMHHGTGVTSGFSYGELSSTTINTENNNGHSSLLLVGLGERTKLDYIRLRHCAALVTRWTKEKPFSSLCINLPAPCYKIEKAPLAILEGVDLSVFEGLWVRQTHNYKSDENLADDWENQTLKETQLVNPLCSQAELDAHRAYCHAVHLSRELVATPANIATPQELLAHAQGIADKHSLQLNVLDESALEKKRMNGICAVSNGATRPLFLHLQYKPAIATTQEPLALIGLGLTFDPDGLSQGHSGTIEGMKKNMAGAANVLAAAEIIAQQKPPQQVEFILPLAERDRSLRPGDIITLSNGETIEINGPHIEGHLMLADALLFAQSLGAQRVVSTATLSNAPVSSLGSQIAPLWSSTEAATAQLIRAGAIAGEKIWPLPVVHEQESTLISPFADYRTPREEFGAGLIALFLQQFIGTMEWSHLDISGTCWSALADGYLNAGATGWGVGTLTNWVDIVTKTDDYNIDGKKLTDGISPVAGFDVSANSTSVQTSNALDETIDIAVLTSVQVTDLHQMRLDMTATLPRAFGPSNEQLKKLPLSHSQQCFKNHWGADNNFILAAWQGQQLIGTIGLLRCEEGNARHIAVVWNVFVRPSHQGKGIARRLLQGVIDKARGIPELERLKLELSASETPAFNLYKRFGFTEFGREPAGLKLSEDYFDVINMSMAL